MKLALLILSAVAACAQNVSAPLSGGVSRGASLPATCRTGDMYFLTNAAAGQQLRSCIASNTWAVVGSNTLNFRGSCQGSTAVFLVDLPSGGLAPMPSGCASGTKSVLQFPIATSTQYFILSGITLQSSYVANSAIPLQIAYRSADSTHATTVTPAWACVTTGSLDYPSFTSVTPLSLTAAASSNRTVYSGTITPTCASGNELRLKFLADTTAMTSVFEVADVRVF